MLFDVLEVLPTDDDWFEEPRAGTIVMSLCAKSGMLASVHCEDDQMQFVYPSPNDKIHLPLDLNGEQQKLVVELNHKDREAEVFWYLDEEYIGVTMGTHQMSLQPNPGEHLILCIDLDGDKVELPFSILHVKDVAAR